MKKEGRRVGDNGDKRDGLKKSLIDKCIKKTKNPLLVLLIIVGFQYGAGIGIFSPNVISYIFCLFLIACIIWRDKIVICFAKLIEFLKYKEEQKTIRHELTERRKTEEYEYLKKQEKEAKKKQADSPSQNDDDSSCRIYEIKRKGS